MVWIILVAYVLAGLATYRRVGYTIEKSLGTNDSCETHEFRSVCDSCRCKNCGGRWGYHFVYRTIGTKCDNYEQKMSLHIRTVFMLPVTMAFWWLIAGGYGLVQTKKALGIHTRHGFFVEPPKVLSKDERREREVQEREERLAELQASIDAAELENERQLKRQRALGLEA